MHEKQVKHYLASIFLATRALFLVLGTNRDSQNMASSKEELSGNSCNNPAVSSKRNHGHDQELKNG